MKNMFTCVTAVLLVVWYSLSVIGFDVHTCSADGETYIATVASGFSCEDIHPDSHVDVDCHSHSDCGCCHRHNAGEEDFNVLPCCTNDFQAIVLTGERCAHDSDEIYLPGAEVAFAVMSAGQDNSIIFDSGLRGYHRYRSRDIVSRNVQASYSIWRI